jgi:hypothetical protein
VLYQAWIAGFRERNDKASKVFREVTRLREIRETLLMKQVRRESTNC